MAEIYIPPDIESMADLDLADVSYDNQPVMIQGVVSPASQSGWAGTDDYKLHCLQFSAWRRLGGPVANRKLTLLRPVLPDSDYFPDFPKLSVQRFNVILSTEGHRAIIIESLPLEAQDEELTAFAEDLQKPVIFSTELFGDLLLDRSVNWFEAEANWNAKSVQITFPVDGDRPDDSALKTAESLWQDQVNWKKRIENYALNELLELKNDAWLDDNETEITSEQFISAIQLNSITVDADGEFEFWYDDGNLFGGHSIMVSGDLTDGPNEAGIHG